MKKALIYSPYFDSLGGGEVYALHFAKALEKLGYSIEIAWNDTSILNQSLERFDIDAKNFNLNKNAFKIFSTNSSIFKKFTLTNNYELIFFVSDGSIPFLFGKKNIVHFQVPFINLKNSLITKLKLRNLTLVCNSKFTQKIINKTLKTNSQLLYPPVQMYHEFEKEKIILNVGRFTNTLQNKRQDILINAFKNLVIKDEAKDFKLLLVGNTSQKEADKILENLKKQAAGYPIEFMTNVKFKELQKIYGKALIYWHASGFEIEEIKFPHLVEHFGISTVEAMSAGAVPIVINKGGQKEIVIENQNGYLFETEEELINKTINLLKLNTREKDLLKFKAKKTAQKFALEKFYENVKTVL